MVLLKKLVNWLIWLMIPLLVTFLLSFAFDFSYWDTVHAPVYRFFYGVVSVIFTMVYIAISENDNSLDFI